MRCAECSTPNSLDHKHCKECGARLDDGYRTLLREARAAETPAEEQKAERLTQLLDMAFWHNEAGHLDASIKACEAALSLHADNTTAHSLLGTLYEKKGDDATAIRHFQQVVTLNPDSAADAQKLDQLTRGVHVKAAAPPPVSRWIPPALASLKFPPLPPSEGEGSKDAVRPRPRWVPLVGASLAAALVLGVGLSALRGPNNSQPLPVPPRNGEGEGQQTLTPLPLREGQGVGSKVLPSPVAMQPGTAHGTGLSDIIPPPPYGPPGNKSAPDPFAGQPPAASGGRVAAGQIWKQHNGLYSPPFPASRERGTGGGGSIRPLPPLSLRAVPLPGEGIAPAAVSIPAASASPVPQHTVVVSNLQGANNSSPHDWGAGGAISPQNGGAGGASSSSSTPSPHIKITVNSADAQDGGIALSGNGGQITTTYTPAASPDAARLQQSALSAQQNGNYKQARSWYEQAIRAYRAQIAAGRDSDAARAGLQACQTGLSICQQTPL